jgi:hypothetical protein
MIKNKKTFWVVNITKSNVTLSDLNIMIPAQMSVDLLSKGYPHLNENILEKSLKSGSLFAKRNKIIKRIVPPSGIKTHTDKVDESAFLTREPRSLLEIKEEKFEELELSDEEFAEQSLAMEETEESQKPKK